MIYIKAYIGALIVFLALDAIWLGLVAKNFYANQLGDLMRDSPNMMAAGVFYLAYIGGLVFLVVAPALVSTHPVRSVLLGGAIFGFIAYGTYDFTNLATLRNWPVNLVFVDLAWGTVLTATAAVGGYALAKLW